MDAVLRSIERRIVLIPLIRRDREIEKFQLEFYIRQGSLLITDGWLEKHVRGNLIIEENL